MALTETQTAAIAAYRSVQKWLGECPDALGGYADGVFETVQYGLNEIALEGDIAHMLEEVLEANDELADDSDEFWAAVVELLEEENARPKDE